MKLIFVNGIFILLSISCSTKNPVAEKKLLEFPKPFTADSAKADFAKGKYRMITFGFPTQSEVNEARYNLAKAYGFYYDNQGCVIEDNSLSCADEYNDEMEFLLQKRNGKYWKKDFDWKIDSVSHIYDLKHRNDTE